MCFLSAKFLTVVVLVTWLSFSSGLETEGKGKKRPPRASPSPPPRSPRASPSPPPPSPPPPPPSPPPGLGNFDYYVLVVQWTISYCGETDANGRFINYCSNNNYDQFPERFTIHGLWPTDNGGNPPPVQSKEEFNVSKLAPVFTQLEDEWPNAKYIALVPDIMRYSEFWKHEWEKHGTATGLSLVGYFQLALRLHKRVEPYLTQYTRQSMININNLKQRFQTLGGMPAVICNFGGNKEQLFELRFNVTHSSTFVNHQQFGRGCSQTVYLP